jgi:hypothetical protein
LKGKTVTLTWNDTLLANTTYQVDFSNAISDITEGNKCNVAYVFSTGSSLDSLSIAGSINDGITGSVPDKATVIIYTDSLFGRIAYSQSIKKGGLFQFNYLPNKEFYLATLIDDNSNGIWDENEKGAFNNEVVRPIESNKNRNIKLQIASQNATCISTQEFVSDSLGTGFFIMKTGMNKQLSLSETEASRPFRYGEINENSDTLYYALGGAATNNFVGIRMAYGEKCIDTLSAYFAKRTNLPDFKFVGGLQKNPKQLLIIKSPCYSVLNSGAKAKVLFHGIQAEALLAETGSPLHFAVQLDANKEELTGDIRLQILPGAFQTAYGTTNDTLEYKGTFTPKEKLGSLLLHFETFGSSCSSCFVELRNEKWGLVHQVPFNSTLEFIDLSPGKYYVRVVWDENSNGKWDVYDLNEKKEAEFTEMTSAPITVKANWQMKIKI